MQQRIDIDFQNFAKLRGKKDKAPLKWGIIVSGFLLLAGFLLLLSDTGWILP
jgi:hypothetical protein